VVTSGLGGVFPKGLPIGYADKIEKDKADLYLTADVFRALILERWIMCSWWWSRAMRGAVMSGLPILPRRRASDFVIDAVQFDVRRRGPGVMAYLGWLGYAHAPLLLGLVLYYALTHDLFFLLTACFLAGILQDSLGLIPLGYSAFCFCVVGLVVIRSRELMFVRQWTTHLALGAVSAAGVSLALSLMLVLNDQVSMTLPQIASKVWVPSRSGRCWSPWSFACSNALTGIWATSPGRISDGLPGFSGR
jgi:hypothetical protein